MCRWSVLQVPGLSRSGLLSRTGLSAAVPWAARTAVTYLMVPKVVQHESVPLENLRERCCLDVLLGKFRRKWLMWPERSLCSAFAPAQVSPPACLSQAWLPS